MSRKHKQGPLRRIVRKVRLLDVYDRPTLAPPHWREYLECGHRIEVSGIGRDVHHPSIERYRRCSQCRDNVTPTTFDPTPAQERALKVIEELRRRATSSMLSGDLSREAAYFDASALVRRIFLENPTVEGE